MPPGPGRALGARFIVVFLALTIGFQLALHLETVAGRLRAPYCAWLARACGWACGWLIPVIQVNANVIVLKGSAVRVIGGCDGLDAMGLVAAGLLAFPGSLRWRLAALWTSLAATFGFNVTRLVVLCVLNDSSPEVFEFVHVYFFQTLVVAFAVACFVFWADRAADWP